MFFQKCQFPQVTHLHVPISVASRSRMYLENHRSAAAIALLRSLYFLGIFKMDNPPILVLVGFPADLNQVSDIFSMSHLQNIAFL